MNILLCGSNGFIGKNLYQYLTANGHHVRAAVRNAENFQRYYPEADTVQVDFRRDHDIGSWLPRLEDIDLVINAVGIIRETGTQRFEDIHQNAPCSLFDACVEARVRRVIQISALGADRHAESNYHLSKRAADRHLSKCDLDWTILRPSIVYGPGAKSTELFKALAALPLTPLVGHGEQLIQPIYIKDVAKAISLCLEADTTVHKHIDLVGPQSISFAALLSLHRNWLGLGALRPLPIKYPVALKLGKLAGKLGNAPVTEETVAMLARGNTSDVSAFVQAFKFTPRSPSDELGQHPAQTADRWYSSLFFMPWLLRWCIALVWVVTGVCSLGIYPESESLKILEQAGITGALATLLLYGGGLVDLAIGLMMLFDRWIKSVLVIQLSIMMIYTLIITGLLPELWLHPFGPVTKNLPMAAATLCLLAMTRK
ncbi:NAD(P)H-binding protein [Marinobacterium mangrovicola]|uniref:Uncharacterized protein YbjT (DUF2867 family) n=1 Tax=Marinobacterium mangrovicola TaxID=1476959 RepID=A0A4R1GPI2_9GAMM|nr:NAD(P)H-binding protein [Marinobacterium mangrovicola]TCK09233.1 uncharacterized protein YbjT (DUF2867 family) [Marinobacterium mangrovicola]